MKAFTNEMAEIDKLIREAHGLEAQKKLMDLESKKVPVEFLVPFARLCTRAGLPELALKVLHAIVRPGVRLVRAATPEDLAEYGLALLKSGAVSEGKDLLKRRELKKNPETLLYLGISHLREWEYSQASLHFRQFVAAPGISPYQKIIGKANLAISLILEEQQLSEVENLLKDVIEESQKSNYQLLYALCIREMGNLEMLRDHLKEAKTYFGKAQQLLKAFGGHELHYANKWLALLELKRDPQDSIAIKKVKQIREEAFLLKNWESVRNIDYHKALYQKDLSLINHLYFGTPYAEFRKRLESNFPEVRFTQYYAWKLGAPSKRPLFNVEDPSSSEGKDPLKVGMALHRLYHCLTSDFYRPFSVPALFEKIFPGEFYMPSSSKHRVHQCIKNLRKWFLNNSVPLTISYGEEGYGLEPTAPCAIHVRRVDITSNAKIGRIDVLRKKFTGEFSSKDVCKALKLEISSAQALIKEALQSGEIERLGSGRTTRYRFSNRKNEAA